MNTGIRSLDLLEQDLEAAVARERARLDDAGGTPVGGGDGPRRLPRRGRSGGWGVGSVAAALVATLVLAGGIGVLSQGMTGSDESATSGGGSVGDAVEAPAQEAPQATSVPGVVEEDAGRVADGALGATDTDEQAFGNAGAGEAGVQPQVRPDRGTQGQLSKIIRDGRIGIVIADGSFSQGVSRVTQIAKANGGFVLESSSRDERSGRLTLRVPAKRFDDTMLALRGVAGDLEGEVEFQQITGQDVTAEFIDLQARLDILLGRRDLLRELQRDATTSGEILRLATLIDDVQFQIESLQGRLRFLRDQVAEATIKVDVREREVEREDPGPDPENPSLGDSLALGVQGFLRVLGAVVVGLGYLIPLAVIALIVWALVTLVRHRGRGAS